MSDDPIKALLVEQRNIELKAAYDLLSKPDKIAYDRGYKTFKRRGGIKSEVRYMLVDNHPFGKTKAGTKFTPKKKKRKK